MSNAVGPSAIGHLGNCGDSALHWAAILPEPQSHSIVTSLLNARAPVDLATFQECPITNSPNGVDLMPTNTTALEWAVITDNIDVVLLIEEWISRIGSSAVSNSTLTRTTTLLSYAAQYQSIRCLDHFCQTMTEDQVNSFDLRGFSPFYFAVQPDILGRVLRYDSSLTKSTRDVTPFIGRQIEVMSKLIEVGSNRKVHHKNWFTCLHMAAAQGEPEILDYLLESLDKELINERSAYGWTPLRDAILRGNVPVFHLLLEKGADRFEIWKRHDALHLCCMYQGSHAVDMATEILDDSPVALEFKNHESLTSLQLASQYGHIGLIDLFVLRGARLLDPLFRLTPLGIAIRSRHVLAVALLCLKHREQNAVLMAGAGVLIVDYFLNRRIRISLTGKYASAIQYLLAPGRHSPNSGVKYDSIPLQTNVILIPLNIGIKHDDTPRQSGRDVLGCYDTPFSRVSETILDILLQNYEHRVQFRRNFLLACFYPIWRYDSGLRWAVRTSNIVAIKRILEDNRDGRPTFVPDLRDLVELACCQFLQGMSHMGSPELRREVADYLREKQIDEFRSTRLSRIRRRMSQFLHQFWTLYYRVYGDMEQTQYERAITWQLDTRPKFDPRFLEFRQWHSPRFSLYIIVYVIIWALLLPLISCYGILAREPSSHISPANIACTVVAAVLVSWIVKKTWLRSADQVVCRLMPCRYGLKQSALYPYSSIEHARTFQAIRWPCPGCKAAYASSSWVSLSSKCGFSTLAGVI